MLFPSIESVSLREYLFLYFNLLHSHILFLRIYYLLFVICKWPINYDSLLDKHFTRARTVISRIILLTCNSWLYITPYLKLKSSIISNVIPSAHYVVYLFLISNVISWTLTFYASFVRIDAISIFVPSPQIKCGQKSYRASRNSYVIIRIPRFLLLFRKL